MSLPRDDVVYAFTRTWWVFLLRGALAVAFGLVALIWPGPTLFALVLLFGAFVLVDGIISIYSGAGTEGRQVKWSLVAWGTVGVLVSVAVLFWPGITALVLLYLIAAWAIITGLAVIVAATDLRTRLAHWWTLALAGLLSVTVGAILAFRPGAGVLSLVWLIGIYAIMLGVLLITSGLRLRSWRKKAEAGQARDEQP